MKELVLTEDGSFTMFNREAGELYHNRVGAYTEALQLYANACDGAQRLRKHGRLRLLDACFGLGYNTLVLLCQLSAAGCAGQVEVDAVEIDPEVLGQIPAVLEDERLAHLQSAFAQGIPDRFGVFGGQLGKLEITLHVIDDDLRKFSGRLAATTQYDLIFHDPFSPRKIPELWTVDLFAKYYQALAPGLGMLLTYSCAGAVRGGLQAAGFGVFQTAAVGKRRGGTLAQPVKNCAPPPGANRLALEEIKRLEGLSGVPYRDSDWQSQREDILARRAKEQESFQRLMSPQDGY